MRDIPILSKDAYRGAIRVVSQGVGNTHIAKITDENGKKREVYASMYPQKTHPRSLVNEITAYLLASKMNLPTPPKAWIVFAPITDLIKIYPNTTFNPNQSDFPLWCTSKISGKSAKTIYTTVTSSLLKDLANWKSMPDVIAFDEWTANIDRNIGNLIRTSKSNYIIIDNEDIATGRNWTEKTLNPLSQSDNKLVNILFGNSGAISLPIKNKMVLSAEDHSDTFTSASPKLKQWWEDIGLTTNDKSALCSFIGDRAKNSVNAIGSRYNLIV